MALFQRSVSGKYIHDLNKEQLNIAWQHFQSHFHNPHIQNNILNAKEEEYQEGFVRDLFVNILGYTLKPQPDYNLVLEQKSTSDSTKSDGAILSFPLGGGREGATVTTVIELKDTNTTDLDKVEKQAFGYKHQHKDCIYVITANFEKLRLYINDAIDYEEFDLFRLSKEQFSLLYCCLQQQALLNDVPLKMKHQSIAEEENITKKLYADYSRFKKQLFANITEQNPQYNKLELYKKTQKLLDRFLFILFAEDRLLVPPNSVREILQQWEQLKELDNYVPLYERFKKYFGYLDTGYLGKQYEIFAYNGGLFAPDEILDNITINDQLLYDSCKGLSNYDYQSEVDVNILGHIFEHSLTEIEEVERSLSSPLGGARPPARAGTDGDGSVGRGQVGAKRKKDGVFYTPRYITKYIVENTIGALCIQKKEELQIVDEEYSPQKRKANTQQLLLRLEDYRQWLLQLTICDPACGSGAFLNQALEFLISEHRGIDEMKARLFGDTMMLSDVEASILENNLYGVDINEEAVEIARLSLWLRTARKGRKLNNLNQHIKCGNSLIDDAAIAGDKAFDWQKEFPEVFSYPVGGGREGAGFDVVIGNPPYVSANNMTFFDRAFFNNSNTFKTLKGKWDLYIPFVELGLIILNQHGRISFITPYGLLNQPFGEELRKEILKNYKIESIVDLHDLKVFQDATVPSCITVIENNKSQNHQVDILKLRDFDLVKVYQIDIQKFHNAELTMFRTEDSNRIDHIKVKVKTGSNKVPLGKLFYVSTGAEIHGKERRESDGTLISGHSKFNVLFVEHQEGFKEYIEGSSIPKSKEGRYCYAKRDFYLNYDAEIMRSPKFPELFDSQKIMVRGSSGLLGILATLDERKLYTPHKVTIIIKKSDLPKENSEYLPMQNSDLKYLLTILNSHLINFYYKSVFGGFIDVYPNYLKALPIPDITIDLQQPFIAKADIMLSKNKELQQLKQQLLQLLQSKYEGLTLSKKLQNWPGLSFKEFLKELDKQKIKLSLPDQSDWMQYFEAEKAKANAIQQLIDTTDKEIDDMVYELYCLTEEERKIVEGG